MRVTANRSGSPVRSKAGLESVAAWLEFTIPAVSLAPPVKTVLTVGAAESFPASNPQRLSLPPESIGFEGDSRATLGASMPKDRCEIR